MAERAPDRDPGEQAAQDEAADRRCAVCGVQLSMYNPGPHCWQHRIGFPWRGPAAKPKY